MSLETEQQAPAEPALEPRRRTPRGRSNPFLPFIRRWGISIASLVGGLLTLLVFRREVDHIRWVVGYVLLAWLLFALAVQVRRTVVAAERRVHRLVVAAADYTIQTLCHGVLLFLLPAYWASATPTSRNVVFLVLLAVLALIATFDPWYRALVSPRPWLGGVFLFASMFGALNLALPLVGVPPHVALPLAAWAATLALAPAIVQALHWPWLGAVAGTTLAGVGLAALAFAGRAWIPPAPLFIAETRLAWGLTAEESVEPVAKAIPTRELRERGLVVHTAVYAPADLTQSIRHVWRQDGRLVDEVPLSPVRGGRREGFRTFSRKTAWPADPRGRWTIDVVTDAGQLVGRLSFRVTG